MCKILWLSTKTSIDSIGSPRSPGSPSNPGSPISPEDDQSPVQDGQRSSPGDLIGSPRNPGLPDKPGSPKGLPLSGTRLDYFLLKFCLNEPNTYLMFGSSFQIT